MSDQGHERHFNRRIAGVNAFSERGDGGRVVQASCNVCASPPQLFFRAPRHRQQSASNICKERCSLGMACVFYAIAVHLLVVGRGNALFRSSNTTLYRALAGWLAVRSLTLYTCCCCSHVHQHHHYHGKDWLNGNI